MQADFICTQRSETRTRSSCSIRHKLIPSLFSLNWGTFQNFLQMKQVQIFLFLIFSTNLLLAQCENGRYLNMIFPEFTETENIPYGSNIDFEGNETELLLDVYQPLGDTEVSRPLIIFAHGGSFVGGSKDEIDVAPLCEDFARMGYVTASINYRLGIPLLADVETSATEAVARGYHDMKAAIRFFRKDVAENGNQWNIDPDKIIIAGSSAGGFITTHIAFMDELEELPPLLDQSLPGLGGGLDGTSGNEGYSSEVIGVVNIAGALLDVDWMTAEDEPILSFHGTGDATVPFGEAMLQLFGLVNVTVVAGSSAIHEQADAIGLTNCFEIYDQQGHVPHVSNQAYYDTTRSIMSNFTGHLVCPNTVELDCEYRELTIDVLEVENEQALLLYPNPSNGVVTIQHPFKGNARMSLFSQDGKLILDEEVFSNIITRDLRTLPSGLYLIRLVNDAGEHVEEKLLLE